MTYLEPTNIWTGAFAKMVKTAKAPSQKYAALLNTSVLREQVEKF